MTVVLTRVDERLVHGQVLVGWRPEVGFNRIGVADDLLVEDDWERDLVASAADEVPVDVLPPGGAGVWYAEEGSSRRIVLLRSLASLAALVRSGAPVGEVNLGGLHARGGARRFLDYLWVTREDVRLLHELAGAGVRLVALDLPGGAAIELNPVLAEGRLEYDHLPAGGP